jgi:acyl-CoA synthetase (AMP-forming)/AMP-acid ligase II
MQPHSVLVRDSLPRNANGKLDRVAIVQTATAELTS